MDENSTDPNQENINSIENAAPVEEVSELSARDSQPYNIPVNKISQVESQPAEASSDAVVENNYNDFQNRQETLAATKTKKPKNKKKLIILAVILILIASGAGVAYLYFNQDTDNESDKTTTKTVDKSAPAKKVVFLPADAVDAVKTAITTKYPQVVSPDTKLTGDQVAFRTSDTAPYWKISGEKFYVDYTGDGASNLGVYYVGQSTKVSETIAESLLSQGFVLATGSAYDGEMSSIKAYTKQDVICTADTGAISEFSRLNCGQLSKYSTTLESYKLVKPFADAYVAGGGTVADGSIFSGIEIRDSITIGYKTAEVGLGNAVGAPGGAMGLFYKKGDANWQFFLGTQQAVPCTEYKTVDLVNAFKNQQCYDATKTGSESQSYVH
jgi:hypothetical protein